MLCMHLLYDFRVRRALTLYQKWWAIQLGYETSGRGLAFVFTLRFEL